MTDHVHISEGATNAETAKTDPVPVAPDQAKPLSPEEQAAADAAKAKAERHDYLDSLARTKAAERRAKAELAAERGRIAELEQQRQADLARAKALEEQASKFKNPETALAELERMGLTPQQLAREVMEQGTPERVLAKLKAEAEAIAEQKVSAFKKEIEQQRQAELLAQVEHNYLEMVQKNEDKYPALTALYTPRQLLDMTREVLRHPDVIAAQRRGITYSDEEIANFLEEQNKERYTKISQRFGSSAISNGSNGSTSAANGSTAKSAPNVTNASASSVGTGQRKSPKTQAELEAAILEDYNRIVAARRAP